jgi:hypothetical protein
LFSASLRPTGNPALSVSIGDCTMPSVKERRSSRKKRRHHHSSAYKPSKTVETRQSWFGSWSILVGLLAFFFLTVQGILLFQKENFAAGAMILLITWVTRLEIVTAVVGINLSLLSFPFSSRRQRNAVLGFLLNAAAIGTWVYLANWRFQ